MTLILDANGRPFGGAATPFALPTPLTFSSIFGGAQQTFFHLGYDQAYERSREDALLMRNDCFLMGLLQERKLGTAGLRWHLEVDDERDPWQRMVRDHMEAAARSVKHLPRDVFMPLMEAVWPGRSGVQCVWKWREQTPPPISIPAMNGLPSSSTPLGPVRTLALDLKAPVNGDKIGHRYSGLPYVEVNVAEGQELAGAETIVTTQTRAMLLKGSWRDRFLLHTHAVEDPDYFDAKRGDMVYGVGVRSVLFWHDWLKREYLAWLTDFLERYGLGLTLVSYDESNAQSKLAAQKIIDDLNGRKMAVMVPVIPGQSTPKDALARIETPQSAAEVILKLMKLFDHYIRYYVLGDESGEEGRSKGGDEVREMTSAKWKMYRLDALNLADTLTSDYLDLVKRWTFPWADFPVRWRFDLDSPDVGERIGAMNKLWDMGVRFKEDEARGLLGMSKPQEGDDTISKAQQLEREASLKAATMDPNRTAGGTFATKGKTVEDEGKPGGEPADNQPSPGGVAAQAGPHQFVRVYKGREPRNPSFEEKHRRSPMGDHDPQTGHSSNPDGGDWEEGGPNPQTGGKAEPAKPAAPAKETPKAKPPAKPAPQAKQPARPAEPQPPVAPTAPPQSAEAIGGRLDELATDEADVLDAAERHGVLGRLGLGHNELFRAGHKTFRDAQGEFADKERAAETLRRDARKAREEVAPGLRALAAEGAALKGYAGPIDLAAAAEMYERGADDLDAAADSLAPPPATPPAAPEKKAEPAKPTVTPPVTVEPAAPQAQPPAAQQPMFPPDDAVRQGGRYDFAAPSELEKKLAAESISNLKKNDIKKLPPAQQAIARAVEGYTGGYFKALNSALRNGTPLDKKQQEIHDGLKAAFAGLPDLPEPALTRRGVWMSKEGSDRFLKEMEALAASGAVYQPRGFVSTSFDPDTAFNNFGFASVADSPGMGSVGLEIVCRKGLYLDAADMGAERELLLDDGSRFRVHAVKTVKYGDPYGNEFPLKVVQLEQL